MAAVKESSPVLIVEDDRKTASLVALYLEREGFKTISAYDGKKALELAQQYHPIFVILDLMLPSVDGWEICRELRRSSEVPILILTAREEEMDRVLGLSLGADDYVVKPFSPRELVARVKAILRRVRQHTAKKQPPLSLGALTLNHEKRRVTLKGQPVSLTLSEYKLLETLMAAPGRVFTREELLNSLYPTGESVIDRVIDVHIGKLRQKIEDDATRPRYIQTVRGLGYRLTEGNE
ncbi:MAG: response regulator transcription factor [Deltaproteobacteria bacterium]|nr:response regulator transcription factor [Deltaproteobacteria bacterium]MBI2348051.1 response regulator transcription factor [Deltaproteobacteria bacterium]MBI2539928.1 response regulator transcription factor [Deltaproteobacteria bacterium]MBI2991244.1 response regulator transcription factor [Deltaproteobacteria bacterium]MBI3060900.1 response regulator transcription factor [Deltaproteobacteria bacterium]